MRSSTPTIERFKNGFKFPAGSVSLREPSDSESNDASPEDSASPALNSDPAVPLIQRDMSHLSSSEQRLQAISPICPIDEFAVSSEIQDPRINTGFLHDAVTDIASFQPVTSYSANSSRRFRAPSATNRHGLEADQKDDSSSFNNSAQRRASSVMLIPDPIIIHHTPQMYHSPADNLLDWALIPFAELPSFKDQPIIHSDTEPLHSKAQFIENIIEPPLDIRPVFAVTVARGAVSGHIDACPFFLKSELTGSFAKTFVVRLESDICK